MPNVPNSGHLPREHKIHSVSEERGERVLHQAEDENRAFYESNANEAFNVSRIMTGVREDVASTLQENGGLVARLKEERVQSELYRSVQGEKMYETENLEDSKHYRGSQNVEYLERNRAGKLGRQFQRFARGAAAMVGANNFVEAAVDRRFGANRDLEARRRFVAERMLQFVNANLVAMAGLMGVPANADDITDWFATAGLTQLRDLRDNCPINLREQPAFMDLMMLVDVMNREVGKIGMENIYNAQRLRTFHDQQLATGLGIPPGLPVPAPAQMMRTVQDVLVQNSLFPLEENPEGMALMAELETRVGRNPFGAQAVLDEISNIRENELPGTEVSDEQKQQIATCRAEVNPLLRDLNAVPGRLINSQNRITNLNNDIATITADITALRANIPALSTTQIARLQVEITRLQGLLSNAEGRVNIAQVSLGTSPPEHRAGIVLAIDNMNREIANYSNQIKAVNDQITDLQVNGVDPRRLTNLETRLNTLTASLTQAETDHRELENTLRSKMNEIFESFRRNDWQSHIRNIPMITPPVNIFAHLANTPLTATNTQATCNLITQELTAFDTQVVRRLEQLVARARITPFMLLQRLLRRDYLQERDLNANVFSEEADIHATLKATLRVKDAENVDIFRSANDNAAEFLNKGILTRGGNKLKLAVARGQNFVGLEPITIRTMTADAFLEQLVNSHTDFHVFRGINKFTTTRDLTHILNQTGKKVSVEVLERFIQIMEESISQFKKVGCELNGKLNAGDWDLENLILSFQKLKMQRWNRDFMDKLETVGGTGNREHAFLKLLRESRTEEKRISAAIRDEIRHPDAMWRKLLFKDELKKVLDKDVLDGTNKLKEAGIASREKEISKKQERANSLPDGSAEKQKLLVEINNQKSSIETINRQIADAKDLYERVEDAKKYIAENELSRAQKREYLAQTGLTQVFDKMGTNFRLQRYWDATKRGAKWTGGKMKEGWSWSRRKFLNLETAKSVGRKTVSVLRVAATPITTPLGWAWKAGTFPVRLTGRALLGTARIPSRLWRLMSKSAKRDYLRERHLILSEQHQNIVNKQAKLHLRMSKVPYSWDRRRLLREINKLEEEKVVLGEELRDLGDYAQKSKIPFDTIGFNSAAATDNAVKAPAPATEAPKTKPKGWWDEKNKAA